MMYSIGVDIGGSHITSGMFEHMNKQLIDSTIVTLPVDNGASKSDILSQWTEAIQQTMSISDVAHIEGIGLAVPGPFDYYNGICLINGVQKFDSLYKVNVREELSSRLNFPGDNIRFINDAASFSIGEAKFGEASAFRRCVAITLGTGFGSCFLVDGQPIVNGPDIPLQGVLYDKYFDGHMADDLFSTRGLINSFDQLTGKKADSVLDIYQMAKENTDACQVFRNFGSELGKFLKPHLTLFNAEVLVLGGNISKAYEYFGDDLQEQLPGIKISVSKLNEYAALIGGASLLEKDYYSELSTTLKLMN
ncbi:ROK family protein [Marinoscillum sp.]|uniref:ROK family protein n=1 Tax=Marinoscillum sp. TaxID=2024838 RepID=UPI003BABB7EA